MRRCVGKRQGAGDTRHVDSYTGFTTGLETRSDGRADFFEHCWRRLVGRAHADDQQPGCRKAVRAQDFDHRRRFAFETSCLERPCYLAFAGCIHQCCPRCHRAAGPGKDDMDMWRRIGSGRK